FLLDGQMAVVDDYLELRPHAEEQLRRLGASGRLSMGPWYVLMDEFCVSGETIVRDLQLGLERAAAFGGAMDVGYLPDMFGHVARRVPGVGAHHGAAGVAGRPPLGGAGQPADGRGVQPGRCQAGGGAGWASARASRRATVGVVSPRRALAARRAGAGVAGGDP